MCCVTVLMAFYLGAAFYLKRTYSPSRQSVEVNFVIWGLKDYWIANGIFPVLSSSDVPISDLIQKLTRDGFLALDAIPTVFNENTRYVSNGETAEFVFQLAGRQCTIQVAPSFWGTGWWGTSRRCRYYDFESDGR